MKGDRERCLEAGMDGYVSKPIRAAELHAAIDQLVPAETRRTVQEPVSQQEPVFPQEPVSQDEPISPEKPVSREEPVTQEVRTPSDERPTSLEPTNGVFDWQAARHRTELPEAALRELANLFLTEAPRLLAESRSALEKEDREALYRAAHSLRGSASLFVATTAADLAAHLESIARQGDLKEADAKLSEMQREFQQLCDALSVHLQDKNEGESGNE
jgi:two-component system, sensor histidine kinase and response regulator